jgi:hypothetical protein
MDLILGVLIFMIAVGIIYTLLASKDHENVAPLRIESELIATKLSEDPSLRLGDNNQIDNDRLKVLLERARTDYEGLKVELGVENDFCIFLRDEAGNLTYIFDDEGNAYTGIGPGSGELNLSGTPCGCKVGSTPQNCHD